MNIEEAAAAEQENADADDDPGIDEVHHLRHEWDDEKLRKTQPDEDRSDLGGVVPMHLPQV